MASMRPNVKDVNLVILEANTLLAEGTPAAILEADALKTEGMLNLLDLNRRAAKNGKDGSGSDDEEEEPKPKKEKVKKLEPYNLPFAGGKRQMQWEIQVKDVKKQMAKVYPSIFLEAVDKLKAVLDAIYTYDAAAIGSLEDAH